MGFLPGCSCYRLLSPVLAMSPPLAYILNFFFQATVEVITVEPSFLGVLSNKGGKGWPRCVFGILFARLFVSLYGRDKELDWKLL
jgi:hypothetical protein